MAEGFDFVFLLIDIKNNILPAKHLESDIIFHIFAPC